MPLCQLRLKAVPISRVAYSERRIPLIPKTGRLQSNVGTRSRHGWSIGCTEIFVIVPLPLGRPAPFRAPPQLFLIFSAFTATQSRLQAYRTIALDELVFPTYLHSVVRRSAPARRSLTRAARDDSTLFLGGEEFWGKVGSPRRGDLASAHFVGGRGICEDDPQFAGECD